MLALEPTEFLKPSSRVLYLSAVAATLQVPGMLARVLASGPIKAMLPLRCKGSRLSWFFSSTNVSVAIWRAMERCSGVNTSFSARFTSQYLYGLANSPSLYLASRMRRQALSMSASVTLPSFRDFSSVPINPSATMSMSVPAVKARADTSCRSPIPWSIISEMAV